MRRFDGGIHFSDAANGTFGNHLADGRIENRRAGEFGLKPFAADEKWARFESHVDADKLTGKRLGLFHKLISAPFAVALDDFRGGGGFLRGLAFGLAFHEIGVRGEIVKALAFEIGEAFRICASP